MARHKYESLSRTVINILGAICLLAIVSFSVPLLLLPLIGDHYTDFTIVGLTALLTLVLASLIF